jgi:hypothetical protein
VAPQCWRQGVDGDQSKFHAWRVLAEKSKWWSAFWWASVNLSDSEILPVQYYGNMN